jgi:hypothetical protein
VSEESISYEAVDPILQPWSAAHTIHVFTEYKDEPVRTMDIVSDNGSKIQIWIDPPTSDSLVSVHVWDYSSRRRDLSAPLADLATLLDDSFAQATVWLSEK